MAVNFERLPENFGTVIFDDEEYKVIQIDYHPDKRQVIHLLSKDGIIKMEYRPTVSKYVSE
jgi:hypothetical protein